jgi:hypothetical protein
MVGLTEQIKPALLWICVKTHEQPFFGTVFVFQKTCVTWVGFRRVSRADDLMQPYHWRGRPLSSSTPAMTGLAKAQAPPTTQTPEGAKTAVYQTVKPHTGQK